MASDATANQPERGPFTTWTREREAEASACDQTEATELGFFLRTFAVIIFVRSKFPAELLSQCSYAATTLTIHAGKLFNCWEDCLSAERSSDRSAVITGSLRWRQGRGPLKKRTDARERERNVAECEVSSAGGGEPAV
ncbi:hypothetical protein EYF80_011556 [Liparis tanakae]|uniref:Uncharacterized protein n=1 Tax=Liparis tanakae TaxID=230148 RepID=A0A4Z2IKB7_9TELE|nr:hypothetical protein EYF80_011556 [Liparis tanakae]